MAEHKYYYSDIGVTIKRLYVNDPDDIATLDRIRSEIDEVRANIDDPDLWFGLKITFADNDAAETLDTELDEYSAAGLTYSSIEKIVVRVRDSDPMEKTLRILSHELGHWVAGQAGLNKKTPFATLAVEYFKSIMPMGQAENDSWSEAFAEVWASIMGTDEFRGAFSDGKKYYPSAAMKSFIKAIYHAGRNANPELVDRLWADGGGLVWREKELVPVWWWFNEVKKWYRITPDLKLQNWNDGKWN